MFPNSLMPRIVERTLKNRSPHQVHASRVNKAADWVVRREWTDLCLFKHLHHAVLAVLDAQVRHCEGHFARVAASSGVEKHNGVTSGR